MLKKLKDLVINDMFTLIGGHTIYKVTMLFHSAKQLLAYDAANNRYCVFTVYDEDEVKLVDNNCMTGKDLMTGDKFLWSDKCTPNLTKTVVQATDVYIVYRLTKENGKDIYNVIYKDGIGWNREIMLCE